MKENLLKHGNEIIEQLNNYNYAAFFVGGCVRDLLLNRPIGDIDIVTEASPEQITKIFPKTIPLGIEHGTIIIRHNGMSFEVSTFRFPEQIKIDKSLSKHEQVKVLLYNDLKHRDFTINAIAMNKDGTLIDPFKGQEDIRRKIIKGVHNDYKRLNEDPLRILRAFRFVSELGFTIDRQTTKQIKIINKQLTNVSIERINQEFDKLLKGTYVDRAFYHLVETETFKYLPVLKNNISLFYDLSRSIEPLQSLSEFFALINYLDKQLTIKKIAKAWKCSRKIIREANILYEALNDLKRKGINRWLVYQLGKERLVPFLRLVKIIDLDRSITLEQLLEIYYSLSVYSREDIAFTGNHLKELYPALKPGLWMSEILLKVEKLVVNNELQNNFTKIKEWVKCHPPDVD